MDGNAQVLTAKRRNKAGADGLIETAYGSGRPMDLSSSRNCR